MKKAQTSVEYLLLMIIFILMCLGITALINRDAIIHGGSFGVKTSDDTIVVPPMTD